MMDMHDNINNNDNLLLESTVSIPNDSTYIVIYRIVSNKRSPSNKRPPNLFSNKTR